MPTFEAEFMRQIERQLVNAAGYCCSCTKPLSSDETYCCESCALESVVYRDPNGYLAGDEEDG